MWLAVGLPRSSIGVKPLAWLWRRRRITQVTPNALRFASTAVGQGVAGDGADLSWNCALIELKKLGPFGS